MTDFSETPDLLAQIVPLSIQMNENHKNMERLEVENVAMRTENVELLMRIESFSNQSTIEQPLCVRVAVNQIATTTFLIDELVPTKAHQILLLPPLTRATTKLIKFQGLGLRLLERIHSIAGESEGTFGFGNYQREADDDLSSVIT
ncbi:hypothetical protein TorRG33x02_083530 [Trema orientale]|uniref:Uncharacterized protein n=1 Tax=Trema orientale TaxID=63057 RepID=A0A2P5FDG3_TREOI|nr:hypothetical protein TorRG33x02_083530 [Trema orientale]